MDMLTMKKNNNIKRNGRWNTQICSFCANTWLRQYCENLKSKAYKTLLTLRQTLAVLVSLPPMKLWGILCSLSGIHSLEEDASVVPKCALGGIWIIRLTLNPIFFYRRWAGPSGTPIIFPSIDGASCLRLKTSCTADLIFPSLDGASCLRLKTGCTADLIFSSLDGASCLRLKVGCTGYRKNNGQRGRVLQWSQGCRFVKMVGGAQS